MKPRENTHADMKYIVTLYSAWEKTSEQIFDTLEEAQAFAQEMKDQQYDTIIDTIENTD